MPLPRFVLLALVALAQPVATPSQAESLDQAVLPMFSIAEFGQVMQFDRQFEVLHAEGLARADALADDMLPRAKGPGWDRAVQAIYHLPPLRAAFNRALRVELAKDPQAAAEISAFFASDLGQRVLGLEIAARLAFLDVAQEEAARVAADTKDTARDPKWTLIQRVIDAGDLVEMNVAAGLSGSLAFMQGLQDTAAYGMALPEEKMTTDVWGHEAQLRADTSAWLRAYFGLAYAPLGETELETYVAFLESPSGRRYSAALFLAFDAIFRQISHDLGRAVGLASQGREI